MWGALSSHQARPRFWWLAAPESAHVRPDPWCYPDLQACHDEACSMHKTCISKPER